MQLTVKGREGESGLSIWQHFSKEMMIMKNRTFMTITTVAGILSALCLIAFYLALHDIFHDYASATVIRENASAAVTLPEWTACALEWKVVGICFWLMVVLHAIFLAGLITNRNRKEQKITEPAPPDTRSSR